MTPLTPCPFCTTPCNNDWCEYNNGESMRSIHDVPLVQGTIIYSRSKDIIFVIENLCITQQGTAFCIIDMGKSIVAYADIHPKHFFTGELQLIGNL